MTTDQDTQPAHIQQLIKDFDELARELHLPEHPMTERKLQNLKEYAIACATGTCHPTAAGEIIEGDPDYDQHGNPWKTFSVTGNGRAFCPCGHDTGTISEAEAFAAAQTHYDEIQAHGKGGGFPLAPILVRNITYIPEPVTAPAGSAL